MSGGSETSGTTQILTIYYFLRILILSGKLLREMSTLHIITNRDHIANLLENGLLPATILDYLATEFEALKATFHHDDEQSFSLDTHGYRVILLESGDSDRSLPKEPNNFGLLNTKPEYVELIQLSDKIRLYRACLMPDNECFVLVYALVGALETNIERWFAQQIVGMEEIQ